MDITCCDIQGAVIGKQLSAYIQFEALILLCQARNILLLSLVIDSDEDQDENSLWDIYYHTYLDNNTRELLRLQAKKLLGLSKTMGTWQQSKYGSQLAFCDSATLADVRKLWELYSVEDSAAEASRFKRRFEDELQKGKNDKESKFSGTGIVLTGFRSTIPAHITAIEDLGALHKRYWKHGSIKNDPKTRGSAKHPNPMFLTLEDEATVHYGTDPLLSFHLATAYAPLHPDSPQFSKTEGLPQLEKAVTTALIEFREWIASYKKHTTGIKIRFLAGDAVSLAYSLQQKRITKLNTACQYRDQFHFRPMVLDGPDYVSGFAPLEFDVIDTSNLSDHFGSMILLTATSPLLRNHVSSVLYTEVMAKRHKSYAEILDNMLCGHVPTLSTLLGLFPVDYWTNTSCLSSGDERMLRIVIDAAAQKGIAESQDEQTYLRTVWKRPLCTQGQSGPCSGPMMIQFDAHQLAQVLYRVYLHMFRDEDIKFKFANINLDAIRESSLIWYHRASFASFLRLVKTRVKVDWDLTMNVLIRLIENRPNAPMGMNYIQELFVYLHLLDVFSCDVMKEWHDRNETNNRSRSMFSPIRSRIVPVGEKWGDMRDWENIPPVVCVTLKVPRNKLSVFTDLNRSKLGTPNVHCLLQDARSSGMSSWQNLFPACQLGFGEVSTRGEPNDDSFEVSVTEDDRGWKGTSALIVAFYVPTFFLLLEPQKAIVAFGVHSTPATTGIFVSKLGLPLNVYETTLSDSAHVYVTRYGPHQTDFPIAPGFATPELESQATIGPHVSTSLTASVDRGTGNIVAHTGRLDITSDDYKSSLQNQCEVQLSTLSPCQVAITLAQKAPLALSFPVSIKDNATRLRIARKSCWIEVIVQVATSKEWMSHPHFMYPVYLLNGKPTNWNIPYLGLQNCPAIDDTQQSKLGWLTPHTSLAMSARERALRENEGLPRSSGEQIRLDFKESIFSLFINFAGLQGPKRHVFGLNCAENGGIHVLILVSSLRLDLSNRVAILDCAILPLHSNMVPKISQFLAALSAKGLCQVNVNDTELRLWKRVLPAYVERCRDWDHRGDCEYIKVGAVPLTAEHGQQFLCTCGNGKIPSKFITDVAHWDSVSKYAVRAAISPPFWAPFADDVYRPDLSGGNSMSAKPQARKKSGCVTCGNAKGKEGGNLLNCAKCMKVKYCSRECQRADWNAHKVVCRRDR